MFSTEGVPAPLVWLDSGKQTETLSPEARAETALLLNALQRRDPLAALASGDTGKDGCRELRVSDGVRSWRVVYREDDDAILVLAIFVKKMPMTPRSIRLLCRKRLRLYQQALEYPESP